VAHRRASARTGRAISALLHLLDEPLRRAGVDQEALRPPPCAIDPRHPGNLHLSAKLRKIRPTHVEAWVKSMSVASGTRTEALVPGTIKTRFVNVRSVFRAAMPDKVVGSDPRRASGCPVSVADAAMSIPSPADVAALLGSADERFLALVAVCAFAGLRLGEAAALQVDDVDFLRRQRHVRRQVQRGSAGAVEIRLLKYGSERAVPIPDELVTMLAAHVALGHRGAWLFQGAGHSPAPEHRGLLVAQDARGCGRVRYPTARPAALLRLGHHRGRLRRGDGSVGARALQGDDHAQHVLAPVAFR
jgi:integrase